MVLKVLRFGAGIILLSALFYFRVIDLDHLRQALTHPGLLILAALASFMTIPISGLRWHILLRSQGLVLNFRRTIAIVTMGAFFANFLPGSAGGEIVRGVYIYQASHGRRISAMLSIFVDRLIGLGAFVLFGAAATLIRPTQNYGVFEYGIFTAAALFVAAIVMLFLFGHRIARLANLVVPARFGNIAAMIDAASGALAQYARNWRMMLVCFVISLVVVFLVGLAIVLVAQALPLGRLSMFEYGIAGIYAMIANNLPLTPGGLGVGESAFAAACIALEPSTYGMPFATIFLVYRCVTAISTLPGLIVYLIYSLRVSPSAPAKPHP